MTDNNIQVKISRSANFESSYTGIRLDDEVQYIRINFGKEMPNIFTYDYKNEFDLKKDYPRNKFEFFPINFIYSFDQPKRVEIATEFDERCDAYLVVSKIVMRNKRPYLIKTTQEKIKAQAREIANKAISKLNAVMNNNIFNCIITLSDDSGEQLHGITANNENELRDAILNNISIIDDRIDHLVKVESQIAFNTKTKRQSRKRTQMSMAEV